jgi:hypothetical protein
MRKPCEHAVVERCQALLMLSACIGSISNSAGPCSGLLRITLWWGSEQATMPQSDGQLGHVLGE